MKMIDLTKKAIRRFVSHIEPGENGCWLWNGYIDKDGYGRWWLNRRKFMPAHRFSYYAYYKTDIKGKVIRHICDNTRCVNPLHLRLGDHEDNVRDRVRKGRSAKGEHHGRAKLTAEKVRLLKMMLDMNRKSRKFKKRELAEMFGVSRRAIHFS